jgi:hypothetical protein
VRCYALWRHSPKTLLAIVAVLTKRAPPLVASFCQVITAKTHMVKRHDSKGNEIMREEPVGARDTRRVVALGCLLSTRGAGLLRACGLRHGAVVGLLSPPTTREQHSLTPRGTSLSHLPRVPSASPSPRPPLVFRAGVELGRRQHYPPRGRRFVARDSAVTRGHDPHPRREERGGAWTEGLSYGVSSVGLVENPEGAGLPTSWTMILILGGD